MYGLFIVMANKTKIVITGPAASGKDYLKNVFANKGFLAGVLDTTRPIRKGEKDGVDYYFKSEENFGKIDYLFSYSYNNWWYGLRKGEWKNKDVFVLTPEYINMLHDKNIHNFVVIYLKIPFWARLFRLLKRNDVDSVFRRMNADRKQFKGFNKQNILIRNLNF